MLKRPTIFFRLRAALARHPNAIGVGSIAFSVIVLGFALAVLVQARHDATARAIENADNLARVIEHDITYTAELTDLSIQAAVDGDRAAALQALALNPLVPSFGIAQKILNDILSENVDYLPQFRR